jgi:hypothetical protein
MEFLTIAYKTPYYEETAKICYNSETKKYILCFKDKEEFVLKKKQLEKGEIEINGNLWKFIKVAT